MKTVKYILFLSASAILTTCMVGPKFRSPEISLPVSYSSIDSSQVSAATEKEFANELLWWNIFQDQMLQQLIQTALRYNYDIATAYYNIEQARLKFKITRASMLPSFGYSISSQYGTESFIGTKSDKPTQIYDATGKASWQIDIFGQIRNMKAADRNNFFATQAGARGVILSVIAEVATNYFTLWNYKNALYIAENTYYSRTLSTDLMRQQYEHGAISRLDYQQALTAQAQANALIPQYKRAIEQTLHALNILTGEFPTNRIMMGENIVHQQTPDIPAGIPADLITRRPDIIQSYYNLVAQNHMIGAAQAARFPSIAITGSGGVLSEEFKEIFRAKSLLWSVAGAITGPIFNFGANRNNVKIEKAKYESALINYQQTILKALGDVEDALTAVNTYKTQRDAILHLMQESKTEYDLTLSRYNAGLNNYIDVINAELTLLNAQLSYSDVCQQHLISYVDLYQALGGGWINY